MDTREPTLKSTYKKVVDKLQNKSEEELQLLYLKFFSDDLKEEWSEITKEANFRNLPEEDIIKSIKQQRNTK